MPSRKVQNCSRRNFIKTVVEGFSSTDPAERMKSLEYFEAGCRIGKKLGAPVINIVATWARELKGPQGFLNIEQDKDPGDMKATCQRYLSMMKEYL